MSRPGLADLPHGRRGMYLRLVTAGLCCELVYALYFLRQFPLLQHYQGLADVATFTSASHAAFATFLGAFVILFLCFAVAWRQVRNVDSRIALWLVLGFGGLFAVTMAFVYPLTSNDVFLYVVQNAILVHYHANPIFTPPSTFPQDPLMAFAGMWRTSGSWYGPLALVVDALPTFVVGGNLLANLILLKLMFSGMILANALAAYHILRSLAPARAVSGTLLVAWNPFVIFEFSGNAHNDIIMMFLALLAVLSMTRGELTLGPAWLVASALVKYATVTLLPLFLVYGFVQQRTWRGRLRYIVTTGAAMIVVAVVVYWPFWQGFATLSLPLNNNTTYFTSFAGVLSNLFPAVVTLDRARVVGRLLFLPVFLYALWSSTRRVDDLIRASFIVLLALIALVASNIWFWYALWPLALGVVVPRFPGRLAGVLLALGVELSAALFFFVWRWLGGNTPGIVLVARLSYIVIFVPPTVVLTAFALWQKVPAVRNVMARLHSPARRKAA